MNDSRKAALFLEPLDVLFFRDGRPFGAASAGTSRMMPSPQTAAGAVLTALLEQAGCRFDRLAAALKNAANAWQEEALRNAIEQAVGPAWLAAIRVRGPWLGEVGRDLKLFLSAPATLQEPKDRAGDRAARQIFSLRPIREKRLPGWDPGEPGLRPLWLRTREPTKPVAELLTSGALGRFLKGEGVRGEDFRNAGELRELDRRTGIGINADRLTAEEGAIYSARFLAVAPARRDPERTVTGFYVEVTLPREAPSEALSNLKSLAFGGEGRRVLARAVAPYRWPEPIAARSPKDKPFLLLTTPGLFERIWKPQALNEVLVGAAVPEAIAVSGWDLARGGPKPTRFAAPAGSVYFLDSLPPDLPDTLSDREEDRRQGWGAYVQGVWSDDD